MGNMCGGESKDDDSVDPSDDSVDPSEAPKAVGKATQRNIAKAEEKRKNAKGGTQLKTTGKKSKSKDDEINFKNPVGGDDSDEDDWAAGTCAPEMPLSSCEQLVFGGPLPRACPCA